MHACRWWQNKLAFASGVSLRTDQFLCSWRHDSIELMEVSLLLWTDQLLQVISNGFGAQRSLLISHFHSHCHSSGPYCLLSGLPAALITFGLTSLKITPQSLRFLKLPFHHVIPVIKSPEGSCHILNAEQTLWPAIWESPELAVLTCPALLLY